MHVHSFRSVDGLITPKEIKNAISSGTIDAVAVTDHNTTAAWRDFKGLPVIRSVEKSIIEDNGNQFHLLIYFMNEDIAGDDFASVMDAVREQDAFASIAHPFDKVRNAPTNLDAYAGDVDALECFNARMCTPNGNKKAQEYARSHGLRMTAGSDAHHCSEIGAAYVEADAADIEEFRKLLLKGRVRIAGSISLPHVHTFSLLRRRGIIHPNSE